MLRSDGTFRGYKTKPAKDTDAPINFFDIQNSTITEDDSQAKKSKFGITIRFMQVSRVIERSFHLDTAAERDEWMTAYKTCESMLSPYDRLVVWDLRVLQFSTTDFRVVCLF